MAPRTPYPFGPIPEEPSPSSCSDAGVPLLNDAAEHAASPEYLALSDTSVPSSPYNTPEFEPLEPAERIERNSLLSAATTLVEPEVESPLTDQLSSEGDVCEICEVCRFCEVCESCAVAAKQACTSPTDTQTDVSNHAPECRDIGALQARSGDSAQSQGEKKVQVDNNSGRPLKRRRLSLQLPQPQSSTNVRMQSTPVSPERQFFDVVGERNTAEGTMYKVIWRDSWVHQSRLPDIDTLKGEHISRYGQGWPVL